LKIKAVDLHKSYRRRPVVKGVSFSVDQGQVVGLLGPNGAGKTTTFYMIMGLVRPNGGIVTFGDADVTKMPMYQRALKGVGYLPQESSIFRRLSVEDNLKLVLEQAKVPRAEANRRIQALAHELQIEAILSREGAVLSGGERRRVEIARALATEPKFILLDEPFTGIDPVTIEELQHIIRRLRERNIGILITDHNVEATLSITDWNYILIDGKVEAEGKEQDIRASDRVRRFYLGQGFRAADPPVGSEGPN
jgi:lipopolysaccharide export system ATP-binding protein